MEVSLILSSSSEVRGLGPEPCRVKSYDGRVIPATLVRMWIAVDGRSAMAKVRLEDGSECQASSNLAGDYFRITKPQNHFEIDYFGP